MLPIIVRLHGDLDISRYPELRASLAAVPPTIDPILVDLTETQTVDSVCLSELLLAKRRWEREGRRVAVLVESHHVYRMLAIADVIGVLDIFTDRRAALAWFARD